MVSSNARHTFWISAGDDVCKTMQTFQIVGSQVLKPKYAGSRLDSPHTTNGPQDSDSNTIDEAEPGRPEVELQCEHACGIRHCLCLRACEPQVPVSCAWNRIHTWSSTHTDKYQSMYILIYYRWQLPEYNWPRTHFSTSNTTAAPQGGYNPLIGLKWDSPRSTWASSRWATWGEGSRRWWAPCQRRQWSPAGCRRTAFAHLDLSIY